MSIPTPKRRLDKKRLATALAIFVVPLSIGAAIAAVLGDFRSWILGTLGLTPWLLIPALRDAAGRRSGDPESTPVSRTSMALIGLMILAVSGLLAAVALLLGAIGVKTGPLLFAWLSTLGKKDWAVAAAALLTTIVGFAFFIFRLRQRFLYGATEALAGAMIAAHRVSLEPTVGLPTDSGFYFAILTAGIYLVVRGLDNIYQAIRAQDPIVRWATARSKRIRALLEPESAEQALAAATAFARPKVMTQPTRPDRQ